MIQANPPLVGASMPHEADAQALRRQVLDLLTKAQSIDGLKPFSVVHSHKHGEGHYLVWADKQPSQADLAEQIPSFEPEREEYLVVNAVDRLEELAGLICVVSGAAEAPVEEDRGLPSADVAAYLRSGGCRCPFCGNEDIVGEGVEIDAGIASQEVSCSACHRSWHDDYTLTGFREIT
jgi:hypothetical protein